LPVWRDLIKDGKRLLGKMGSGKANLPTDWVSLASGGKLARQRLAAANEL
jgi:endoglucanase